MKNGRGRVGWDGGRRQSRKEKDEKKRVLEKEIKDKAVKEGKEGEEKGLGKKVKREGEG